MAITEKRNDSGLQAPYSLGVERTRNRKEPLDRLTRDVLAAQAAGMSYGQYKALHPHTPDEDEEPPRPKVDPDKYERVCATCGKVFYLRTKAHTKYCCYNCSEYAASQRAAARARQKKQEEKKND